MKSLRPLVTGGGVLILLGTVAAGGLAWLVLHRVLPALVAAVLGFCFLLGRIGPDLLKLILADRTPYEWRDLDTGIVYEMDEIDLPESVRNYERVYRVEL